MINLKISRKSIKLKLVGLLSICWLLPILFIIVGSTIYYREMIYQRTNDSIQKDSRYSVELTVDRLQHAADYPHGLVYEGSVESAYKKYVEALANEDETFNYKALYMQLRELLIKYFFAGDLGKEYDFVALSLNIDKPFLTYAYRDGAQDFEIFCDTMLDDVLYEMRDKEREDVFFVDKSNIFLAQNLLMKDTNTPYATVIFKIDNDYLFRHLQNSAVWGDDVIFSINGNVGYLKDADISDIMLQDLQNDFKKEIDVVKVGEKRINSIGYMESKSFTFSYAILVGKNILTDQVIQLALVVLSLLVVLLPVMVVITRSIYHGITRPINALVKATHEMAFGNFGVEVKGRADNEFSYLFESFNSMSKEIKHLVDYVYKEEIALKDAKLISLQSQINPHFLNNTLEIINWKARLSDNEEISQMIEALSKLLDASMNRDGRKFIPLYEELMLVDAYLFIIKMRFGQRITIEERIDEEALEIEVPKLIIQPLIENAIVHGIEPVRKGKVWIYVRCAQNKTTIEVGNDGAKMTDDDIRRIENNLSNELNPTQRKPLGIKNVDERLRLIYGEECRLNVYKDQNEHTIASIFIPM